VKLTNLIRRSVETIDPTASCVEAARQMRDARVGSIVVADQGRPLGMVTDRDLALRVIAAGLEAEKVSVRQIMSARPIFVTEDRDLGEVLELMRDLAVRRIPVIDAEQRLVGVVSLDDLILGLSGSLALVAETIEKEM
jgi:CBS domain-containing protein